MPLWFVFTVRPRVCIGDEHVVVRNPLWTVRVPFDEVADAEPGYFGVTVRRHEKRPVTAWAVQQANAAQGTETRAWQLARAIRAVATSPEPRAADPPPRYRTIVDKNGAVRRVSD